MSMPLIAVYSISFAVMLSLVWRYELINVRESWRISTMSLERRILDRSYVFEISSTVTVWVLVLSVKSVNTSGISLSCYERASLSISTVLIRSGSTYSLLT